MDAVNHIIAYLIIWYSALRRYNFSMSDLFEPEVIMFLIMGTCFGLSAFGLLAGAVWAYFSQQRKMESRAAAVGTVVDLITRATTRSSIICPVVEFTTSSGEKIRFTSEFGSRPTGHKVGQSVNVRYDPVDTQKAEIESTMSLWLTPLILVFMGLIACCLAVSFLGIYGLGASSFSP
jgi:hypothetical protein